MRKSFILLYLFAYTTSFAQKEESTTTIYIPNVEKSERLPIPFAAIHVIDARFDQSKIGSVYSKPSFFGISGQKINAVFPDSLKNYLPLVLSTILGLDTASPDKLMVLVKRFRITDYFQNGIKGNFQPQLVLSISASFYAEKGARLYKLFSVDDVVLKNIVELRGRNEKASQKYTSSFIENRSNVLVQLLRNMLLNHQWHPDTAKPYVHMGEVKEAVQKRFTLPVFSEKSNAGIYTSFHEFKNNTPSITAIKIVHNKGAIQVVDTERGEPINLKNAWGASDGQKKYIVFRNQLQELIPSDKSFRILSYRTKADLRGVTNYSEWATNGALIEGAITKLSDKTKLSEYFDLNMDSGTLFLEEMFGTSTIRQEGFK